MEHDWAEPVVHPVSKTRGNLWKCKRCGSVISWNGWPGNPSSDPNYEIPPAPTSSGQEWNKYSSVLSIYLRDCDAEIARRVMGS